MIQVSETSKEPQGSSPHHAKGIPSGREKSRRRFLKFLATTGGALALAPYVPWGEFLKPIVGTPPAERQRLILANGIAASTSNIPVNTAAVFVYPRTGDPKLDAEPFRRYQLIRLPKEQGGDANDASAFRAYSMICVHLWCLWDYKPARARLECPCHGSIYDPLSGLAVAGPAALQTPPNNALPNLDLEVDSSGAIWILPQRSGVDGNGIVGFGRRVRRS